MLSSLHFWDGRFILQNLISLIMIHGMSHIPVSYTHLDGYKRQDYVTFPRDDIAKISGLSMPVNKRNWRKQEQHLRLARGQLIRID